MRERFCELPVMVAGKETGCRDVLVFLVAMAI